MDSLNKIIYTQWFHIHRVQTWAKLWKLFRDCVIPAECRIWARGEPEHSGECARVFSLELVFQRMFQESLFCKRCTRWGQATTNKKLKAARNNFEWVLKAIYLIWETERDMYNRDRESSCPYWLTHQMSKWPGLVQAEAGSWDLNSGLPCR